MRYLPNLRALLSIVLWSTMGSLFVVADTRMAQSRPAAYVAPQPDAEIDAECPHCGETWHLRFYADMPLKAIYRLGEGQTWQMQLLHMKHCEHLPIRLIFA